MHCLLSAPPCFSLVLFHCFGLLHFPLFWHVLPTGHSASGCPALTPSCTEPESLRSVPALAWVKSVQDSISSHAPSCLLISIFSAMSLQETCLSLCVSPTASRALSAPWVCCSALKICELRCHRVLCQSAVLTGDELLTRVSDWARTSRRHFMASTQITSAAPCFQHPAVHAQ